MRKIVIDARELRTSSGRYVERLLHYLQKVDTENAYEVLVKPADIESWQATNPNFKSVSCPHKEFTFAEQLGLKRQVRRIRADLVHFTFAQQPIWYRGRTVTTIHDLTTLRFDNPDKNRHIFKLKQKVYAHVVKKAARKAKAVIVPSEFVKQDVAKFTSISPDKITVTYEAADHIEDAPAAVEGLVGENFVMYVGRPTPHKNLDRLIEAYSSVKANHPDLKLVLAGKQDNNYQRVAAAVQAKGIQGVVFTGFISEAQLRWLYENCKAYVFPSLSEGFGLPGLEAMLHGAPLVSSDATCLPEIYGEAAHYFNPLDVVSMADAINEVLTNQELRMSLINKGRVQASNYSWLRMAQQTLAVYQQALKD